MPKFEGAFPLFSRIGIEIEYMLVDKATLNVKPISDELLRFLNQGEICNQVALGPVSVSNEFVLHVIEFKTTDPAPSIAPLAGQFQETIKQLQPFLDSHSAKLLPTAAHPWMNPQQETKHWPHGNHAIYHQYDKIFSCDGHGWSNVQAMHVNLPFANDEEFNLLHNAIRILLPLLPAIAASSPIIEGKLSQRLDTRLHFYENNQQKIPCITGQVIPEFIRSEEAYRADILAPMYKAIAPYDPEGLLQHSWLNSRGAIPKFDCQAVEIRVLDTQESVSADMAIAEVIVAILKHWIYEDDYFLKNPCDLSTLKKLYDAVSVKGFDVPVSDKALFNQWQIKAKANSVREIWEQLITKVSHDLSFETQKILDHILTYGNLSERIVRAYQKEKLLTIYQNLSECLLNNELYH